MSSFVALGVAGQHALTVRGEMECGCPERGTTKIAQGKAKRAKRALPPPWVRRRPDPRPRRKARFSAAAKRGRNQSESNLDAQQNSNNPSPLNSPKGWYFHRPRARRRGSRQAEILRRRLRRSDALPLEEHSRETKVTVLVYCTRKTEAARDGSNDRGRRVKNLGITQNSAPSS